MFIRLICTCLRWIGLDWIGSDWFGLVWLGLAWLYDHRKVGSRRVDAQGMSMVWYWYGM